MRRALMLALLLAACGPGARAPEAPSFRDRAAPIGSSLRGWPSDLAGDWVVAAAFPGGVPEPGARLSVRTGPGDTAVWSFDGRQVGTVATGPGRHRPLEGGAEIWVLWLDEEGRTAAVGTPDGSFGWIMDRPGRASADRTAAAREVLAWSGYDLSRLVAGGGQAAGGAP